MNAYMACWMKQNTLHVTLMGKNKHAPNVQFCSHPFPTPSLFWVQTWNVRTHDFLSQLVDLHPWPISPVQTNKLTEALLVLTLPHLANLF